jgi:hypothetical protein
LQHYHERHSFLECQWLDLLEYLDHPERFDREQ